MILMETLWGLLSLTQCVAQRQLVLSKTDTRPQPVLLVPLHMKWVTFSAWNMIQVSVLS